MDEDVRSNHRSVEQMTIGLQKYVTFLQKSSLEICLVATILAICCFSSLIMNDFVQKDEPWHRCTVFDFTVVVVLKILAAVVASKLYQSLRRLPSVINCSGLLVGSLSIIFSCFLYAATSVRLSGLRLNGMDEAFAYFVLLMDRNLLIDFVSSFHLNQETLFHHLHLLLSQRTSELILDTSVRVLAVGVGLWAGSDFIASVCALVCAALVTYGFLIVIFFPAALFLLRDTVQLGEVNVDFKEDERFEVNTSPTSEILRARILRNMKMVIVAGLSVLHMHAYFFPSTRQYLEHEHKNFKEIVEVSGAQSLFMAHFDNAVILAYLVITLGRDFSAHDGEVTRITKHVESKNVSTQKEYRASYSHTHHCLPAQKLKASMFVKTDRQVSTEWDEEEHSSDDELLERLDSGHLKSRQLESMVKDCSRAVSLRRRHLARRLTVPCCLERIPWRHFDYKAVYGQSCEEVIGYATVPMGFAGPLLLDGRKHFVPIATTEGCLVASTNRGCRVVERAGGIRTEILRDGMTRAPVLRFLSISDLKHCMQWVESEDGFSELKLAFDSTSSHADLHSIYPIPAGLELHLRFKAETGDAMGMNMVSKGVEAALKLLVHRIPTAQVLSISGNACADKKASAVNWVLGRGKSVIAECCIPEHVLSSLLQVSANEMARLCRSKNLTGSAVAGSIGGFNAHAANLVAAVFLATGQDIAQVVESSSCLTIMEENDDKSLMITCTMPSLEVGTVGGGTRLPGQAASLSMLDLDPREPSRHLARIVSATVLCAELNLMAALVRNELVQAHMKLNRKTSQTKPEASGVLM